MTDSLSPAVSVVAKVCERWHDLGREEMKALFTDDAVYRNMPFADAIVGAEAIAGLFADGGPQFREVEVSVLNIVENGDIVFAERLERIHPHRGDPVSVPVAGVFELRGGRISRWRDYCDGRLLKRVQGLMESPDGRGASGSL